MHIRDVYRSHFYGLKLYYVVFLHRVASLCRDFLFLYSLSWSHLRIVFWGGIQDSVALCISPPLSTKMCDVFFFFCLPSKRALKVQYSPNGSVWHTAKCIFHKTLQTKPRVPLLSQVLHTLSSQLLQSRETVKKSTCQSKGAVFVFDRRTPVH